MFPLLLLALLVASVVGGQQFADAVIGLTQRYPDARRPGMVTDSIAQASNVASFSIIGIVALLWSVLKVFRGLDVAFSSLYHLAGKNGILDQVKDGVIVLGGIVVAVAAMVAAGVVVRFVPDVPYIGALEFRVPDPGVDHRFPADILRLPRRGRLRPRRDSQDGRGGRRVGAAPEPLSRVRRRTPRRANCTAPSAASSLLVTWLYFGALVLLLGVAVNVVLRRPVGSSQTDAEPGGNRSPE